MDECYRCVVATPALRSCALRCQTGAKENLYLLVFAEKVSEAGARGRVLSDTFVTESIANGNNAMCTCITRAISQQQIASLR